MKVKIYKSNNLRRQVRVRSKINGTADMPRLSVHRSNKHIYSQLIDDRNGKTLVSVSDKILNLKGMKKTEEATEVGRRTAELALEKGIKKVIFDRGSFRYHGRVKALADGAREKGLQF